MRKIYLTFIKAYLEQGVIENKGHAGELVIIDSGDYHSYIAGYPDETDRTELLRMLINVITVAFLRICRIENSRR